MKRFGLIAVLILLMGFCPAPARADDGPASAVVRDFYSHLTDTMKAGPQLGYAGRYKQLEPAITSAFNLPLMTRLAVGPSWSGATPAEQQQLVAAFSAFSVANYASQFKAYDGEQFERDWRKTGPGRRRDRRKHIAAQGGRARCV